MLDMVDPEDMADMNDTSEDPGVIVGIEVIVGLLGPITIWVVDMAPLIGSIIDPLNEPLIDIPRITIFLVIGPSMLIPMVDMPIEDPPMDDIFIPITILDCSPAPSPVPAFRTSSGRHSTLPLPFASKLSRQ